MVSWVLASELGFLHVSGFFVTSLATFEIIGNNLAIIMAFFGPSRVNMYLNNTVNCFSASDRYNKSRVHDFERPKLKNEL